MIDGMSGPDSSDGTSSPPLAVDADAFEESMGFDASPRPAGEATSTPAVPPTTWGSTGFGIDIGGTLTKVVFFEPDRPRGRSHSDAVTDFVLGSETYGSTGERDTGFVLHSPRVGGTMHFLKFESQRMESVIASLISGEWSFGPRMLRVCATGGGAHKYAEAFRTRLKIDNFDIFDELQALVLGITHLIELNANECYMLRGPSVTYTAPSGTPVRETGGAEAGVEEVTVPFTVDDASAYPYLVVNIGSGVSIISVTASGEYTRVGGSAIGGGTFFGLTAALTGCADYKTVLELATRGDSSNVDLLVGDIYGGDYCVPEQGINLKSSTVASSFGKFVKAEHREKGARNEDLARAVLLMVTGNLGSLAHLKAEEHSAKHVVYTGSYLANNPVAMRTLAYSTAFWSKGRRSAIFLRHEGYFGAVGALLHYFDKNSAGAEEGGEGGGKKKPRGVPSSRRRSMDGDDDQPACWL